jgi:hypothetical protein
MQHKIQNFTIITPLYQYYYKICSYIILFQYNIGVFFKFYLVLGVEVDYERTTRVKRKI